MKSVFTLVIFLSFFAILPFTKTQAQCNLNICSGPPQGQGSLCASGACILCDPCLLNGYNGSTVPGSNTCNVPGPFCGSIENNQWWAFLAPQSGTVTFNFTVTNCTGAGTGSGIQAEIYSTNTCNDFVSVSNCWSPGAQQNGSVTANNLTPFCTYYLMVDGWAGDFCDFTINTSDCVQPPPPQVYSVIGPQNVCPGATVTYTMSPNPNNSGGGGCGNNSNIIQWNGISPNGVIVGPQDEPTITVQWLTAGVATITASYTNVCFGGSATVPLPVTISPIPPTVLNFNPCLGDCVPCGNTLACTPGLTQVVMESWLGCDSTINCILNPIPPIPPVLKEVTICYPNTYSICGQPFSTCGAHSNSCPNWQGCDSTTVVDLAILRPIANIAPPAVLSCVPGTTVALNGSASTVGSACAPNVTTTYSWTGPPGGLVGPTNTNMAQASLPGQYCLTVTHARGGVSCTDTKCVTVIKDNNVPQTPQITGNNNPCPGVPVQYTVTAVGSPAPTDYTWTTSNGTPFTVINNGTGIEVTWPTSGPGQQVCVTANNACGSSNPACFNVNVAAAPTAAISGSGSICPNSNNTVNLTITLTGAGPWTLTYAINGVAQTPALNIASSPYTLVASQVGSYTLVNLSGSAGCAGVVNGTANVSAYPVPTATLSGTQSICQGSGQTAGLNVVLTGTPPWNLTYAVNNNNQAPITVNASPYTLVLGQSQAGNITLVSLTDGNGCTGTVSGSGTVILNTAPTVSNIQSPCDGTNTSFTVSFTINGGDPATYSVTPANGTLTGNVFTSNPIPAGSGYSFVVTDANNCNPVTVDDPSVPCNCTTSAGDMGPAIEECGNGPVTAAYDGNHVFDADDALAFILHNGSGINIVPPILGTFASPTVSFNPATMSYGTTYYLSAVVGNNNGSGGVDLTDDCLDVAQGTPIVFYEIPTASLSGDPVICQGDPANMTVTFTGSSPWSITYDYGGNTNTINGISSNPYTLTIPNAQTGTVCLTAMGDDNCTGTVSGCSDIQANTGVSATANVTCDLSGTFYTVQITISGGDPASYSVTPNTGTLAGNVFTSNPITAGQGFLFTVDDANSCSPATVQQTEVICDCTTEVGVMTGGPINECGNGPVTATYDNTLQVLDPDDVQSFILHTNSGTNPGTVLATGTTSATFSFNPANMSYGTTYYISAVVGNNDGTGHVDLQDGCLALAQGTPVTFYEVPTATLAGSTAICAGDSTELAISFTGDQPWQVTVGGQLLSNIMSVDYNLTVAPATTTTYTLSAFSDANCPGTVSGSATVTVNQAPQVQNVSSQCDLATNTYTVTFQITGGNPATYTVLPANSGTLTGNTFTSNPIASLATYTFTVNDANNCDPVQITGTEDCNCTTDAGTMATNQINACQGETITVPYSQNPVLDPGEDVLIYYLHDAAGTVLGTVFGTNTEPTFTFNQATMQTGVVYYVSPVAGDNDGSGGVNLSDNCLDISPGTPVLWSVTPTISLVASDAICEGDDAEVTVTFTGTGPSYTVNFTVGGVPSSQTFSTSPFTFMLPLPSTTTIALVSVTDNASGCSATSNQSATVFVSQNVDAGTPIADFEFCDDVSQTISLGSNLQNPDPGGTWTDANGNPVPNGSLNVLPLVPGTYPYTYTVTTTPPCLDNQATLNVIIHPNPVADAGQDYELDCDETEATLGGDNSTPNQDYAWGGGNFSDSTILHPVVNGPGTYTLTVTDPLTGCSDTDVAVVSQLLSEPVAHVTVSGVSCFGEQDGYIVVDSITGGVPPYLCSFNGSPFSTQKQFINLSPGFFTLEIMDAAGCGGSQQFFVVEPEQVNVRLILDVADTTETTNLIVLGDSARLRVISTPPFDSLDEVIWSPESGIDCNTCDTIWISPTQQTTFSITVDKNGCTDSDQLTVFVKKERPVYIPNAFSPNGDGTNDRFMIFAGRSVKRVKSFLVFNRWGESVYQYFDFQPNNPLYGWDGTHRGKPMDPAVFVYFAEIEFVDGRVELYEGDVTLMQ